VNNGDNFYLNLLLWNDGLCLGAAGQCDTLFGETHFLGEGAVCDPFGGCAGVGLFEHLVDLLERKTLGLGNKEVREGERDAAKGAPEEEDFWPHVGITGVSADKVWGDDCDDLLFYVSKIRFGGDRQLSRATYAVPEPVGGSGETDTTRADGKREGLANDDPCGRSPGSNEEKDIYADKRNHCGDGRVVVQGLVIMRLQAGSGQSPLTVISDCPVEAPTATTNKAFGEVGDPDLGVLVLIPVILVFWLVVSSSEQRPHMQALFTATY
jgi:hypothetical protein